MGHQPTNNHTPDVPNVMEFLSDLILKSDTYTSLGTLPSLVFLQRTAISIYFSMNSHTNPRGTAHLTFRTSRSFFLLSRHFASRPNLGISGVATYALLNNLPHTARQHFARTSSMVVHDPEYSRGFG
jgi:hypothetical protein